MRLAVECGRLSPGNDLNFSLFPYCQLVVDLIANSTSREIKETCKTTLVELLVRD